MKYGDYCSYETYKSNFSLEFDCENIGVVAASYQETPQNFTPPGFQPIGYVATPLSGQIKFDPPVIACYVQCHYPAAGISTKHKVQYRLAGISGWTTVTYTDLLPHYVTVAAGTYEFRSAGVVNASPEVFSVYNEIDTVVVP